MTKSPRIASAGFSLPEILIVVLVIAILVVLAIPQMTASLRLNRIQTGSALIASKLGEAKMMAIKKNQQVSVVLDEATGRVWLEANSAAVGAVALMPPGIGVKITPDAAGTTEFVKFNSMGALVTSPATVGSFDSSSRLEVPIRISVSGKITIDPMRSY